MKRFILPIIVLSVVNFIGCSQEDSIPNGVHIQTESFDNFLWKKHVPDTIKAFINTEFAECDGLSKPLVLQLCDEDARPISREVAQLYVNGIPSKDNTLSINPAANTLSTEVWIVLDEKQTHEDRIFTWNLQVVDNPGIVRINETDPSIEAWIPDTTVYWNNNHIANTLEIAFWTILCIILALFVAVVFIMRRKNPAFKTRRLTYCYDDVQKTIVLKGVGRIVFSTKKNGQSFFNQLFTRKTVFVANDFFSEGDVIITPKDRIMTENGRRSGGHIQAKNYTTSNTTIAKGESVDITNDVARKTMSITIN